MFCIAFPGFLDILKGNSDNTLNGLIVLFQAFLIASGLYVMLVEFNTLNVYTDRLEVRSLFGKLRRVVFFSDILTFDSRKVTGNRSGSYQKYVLYCANGNFEYTSTFCNNHAAVWAAITDGLAKDDTKKDDTVSVSWKIAVICIMSGILLFVLGDRLFDRNNRALNKSELQAVTGSFLGGSDTATANGAEPVISIRLVQYPWACFELAGGAFGALDKAYLKTVRDSDRVNLLVEQRYFSAREAYAMHGDPARKKTYLLHIPVYELKTPARTLLAFDSYPHIREISAGDTAAWHVVGDIFISIGGIMLLIVLYRMARNKSGGAALNKNR